MQKIVPHLWFDTQANEAAEFYAKIFPKSKIISSTSISDTPSGEATIVSFNLTGHDFMAISAGPEFKFNPTISFMVNFDPSQNDQAVEHIDQVWASLIDGGEALMSLDEYPFSKRYGWVKDRYGLTWQLMLTNPDGEPRPCIVPSLMFTAQNTNKAEQAIEFYTSVFNDSKVGTIARYSQDNGSITKDSLMYADFQLEGQWFAAMDSGVEHDFTFNEAVSLLVNCDDQAEIDDLWQKLSVDPQAEQCGWLKDKYGLSWQISPPRLHAMLSEGSPEQIQRVTKAFLAMKKFNIAALEAAYQS